MHSASGEAACRSWENRTRVARPIVVARRVPPWPGTTSKLPTLRRSPSVAQRRSART